MGSKRAQNSELETINIEHLFISKLAVGSHANKRKSATRRVVRDGRVQHHAALLYPALAVLALIKSVTQVTPVEVVMRFGVPSEYSYPWRAYIQDTPSSYGYATWI